MVAGCGMKLIKTVLFIFNIVFLAAGIAMITVGALALTNTSMFPWMSSLPAGAIFVIVIGCIIFIVAFFGCWGAVRESYHFMVAYSVCLAVLFLCEIAGAITGFVLQSQIADQLQNDMYSTLPEYSSNTNNMQSSWDNLQQQYDCCGVFNASDWYNMIPDEPYNVPASCCLPNMTGDSNCYNNVLLLPVSAQQTYIYTNGCYNAVLNALQSSILIVGIVCAVVVGIQVVGIIFSSCLAHEFHKSYEHL